MKKLKGVCRSVDPKTETIYRNTPEDAQTIGWAGLPEFCFGNRAWPFVVHNHVKGTFTFVWDVPWDMAEVK